MSDIHKIAGMLRLRAIDIDRHNSSEDHADYTAQFHIANEFRYLADALEQLEAEK